MFKEPISNNVISKQLYDSFELGKKKLHQPFLPKVMRQEQIILGSADKSVF